MPKDIFNFSAGPALIPQSVIEKIHSGLDDFHRGLSIVEVSHRSHAFKEYAKSSELSLRNLCASRVDSVHVEFSQSIPEYNKTLGVVMN